LSWESRCEIVARIEAGMSPPHAAASGGASRATGYRLWRRYQAGGWAGLRDRPSTPHRQPRRLPASVEQRIVAARVASGYGPVRLAGLVPHPPSTIGKSCVGTAAHGCRGRLQLKPGVRVAMSARGRASCSTSTRNNRRLGWQHLHVAIDDHSRLA
jgi:hypothetical protein